MKPSLLILAAGMGSRYGGLKQIEPVGPHGESILEYSVFDALRAGFGKIVFVIRRSFADEFISRYESKLPEGTELAYAYQELDRLPEGYSLPEGRTKPWGTGHAVLAAGELIHEPFAVINADDFYGSGAFREMAAFLKKGISPEKYAMVGYLLKNTLSDFGSVSRGVCKTDKENNLEEITERTSIARKGNTICYREDNQEILLEENTLVSMNFWGFHPSVFEHMESRFRKFLDKKISQPKSEFYIPSVVFEIINTGEAQTRVLQAADSPWFGVTYPEDKPCVVRQIRELICRGDYPESLWR
ncbi:MAG: NDP-sugar synthase [Mangrovibacterium sp.]